MLEQRFEFGAEDERAVVYESVIERLFSDAIARNEKRVFTSIPNCEREHAAQTRNAVSAVLFVGVNDDFGIRARTELVSTRFQFGLQLAIVIDLAVEYNAYSP